MCTEAVDGVFVECAMVLGALPSSVDSVDELITEGSTKPLKNDAR